MNEEEKQALEECKILMICLYDYMSIEKARFYCNQYKIILELIEKQQKEIEKYSEIFKNTIETTLYADGQPIQKIIELTNYISKDKIKELIKKFEAHKEDDNIGNNGYIAICWCIEKIEELLGE